MRRKIVAGNWKMNKTLAEGLELAKGIQEALSKTTPLCSVILAPPYIHLASVSAILDNDVIGLSAQNIASEAEGAYTGEVSASMVASAGCQYTLVGHSERRAYYGEGSEILTKKIKLALANNLTPIYCVGEKLEEREAGLAKRVISQQLEEVLFSLESEALSKVIIAYEPVWAIGTGKTATPQEANEIHHHIRQELNRSYGEAIAENCSILYGGSCNAANAKELFAMSDIDGGLIGGASLAVEKFLPIIEAFNC